MRVKRLEVQGFKSFKDKTVIHFDHEITGIVGPNGCGKSNIVDAFFWVMGEQSYKHMRGSGSDDLIFNGSSKYQPLGLAEATIVFETDFIDTATAPAGASAADVLPANTKKKEISVTRRVYRSGEGEYFINSVPARLKDIKELFMDTGVGAKGYSIIEQGQIGKVVNAKPEERRLLIEEAAGIAKYKARKTESLRKLEAAQSNLSRLQDVISEIERNLNSLERQAQKASQYKKFKSELLEKEMTWGRRRVKVLRQKLDKFTHDRDALEQLLAGLKAELATTENQGEVDRIAQLTDNKNLEELQSRYQKISSELTETKSEKELSRRRQSDLEHQMGSLDHEKSDLEANIKIEQEKIAAQQDGNSGAQAVLDEAILKSAQKDEEVRAYRQETDRTQGEHESAKRELLQGIAQASDSQSRIAAAQAQIESAEAQIQKITGQIQILAERLKNSQLDSQTAQYALAELSKDKTAISDLIGMKKGEILEKDHLARELIKIRDESHKKLTHQKSRLQSLQELAQAHEGFGEGPKAALDWANEIGAPLRALADSYEITAGYEQALEGWLEGRLENLVTADSDIALAALEHLQTQKQGRAAIFVKNAAAAYVSGTTDFGGISRLLAKNGFEVLGPLSSFVRAQDETSASVLAKVCVVKSMEPARAFLVGSQIGMLSGWSLVSLDGSALDATGLLRGGSTVSESDASLLGRKRAIQDLQLQVEKLESENIELETSSRAAQVSLENSREELGVLKSQLQELEIKWAASNRDVLQLDRQTKDLESQIELLKLEQQKQEEDRDQTQQEKLNIESGNSTWSSRRIELEKIINDLDSLIQVRNEQTRILESELADLRASEAGLRERVRGLQRELDASRALISDRERRLFEVNRMLEKSKDEQAGFSGSDSELNDKISALLVQQANTAELLSVTRDRLEQINLRVNQSMDRIRDLHNQGNEKTAETNHLVIEIERTNSEIAFTVQNLEEKYGPGCLNQPEAAPVQEEMEAPVVTVEMTAEEEALLGEEVERLRERIRRLGDVNPEADDQYQEARKRYDYLIGEKADLDTSIQNLKDAIDHINKTSEERFRKAFQAIADRFEKLFPIIFGGGSAKLELVYPEGSTEILDAGVDIMAQPPGKKVSNITLLSGGEKALTAVSLIFAIFMVKPSPFCVLDEVDAPLDDANIGKFNALLREMSIKSQFIIITHNKKTMELNDTLYGVTMEEPGVSKMVSIEMR